MPEKLQERYWGIFTYSVLVISMESPCACRSKAPEHPPSNPPVEPGASASCRSKFRPAPLVIQGYGRNPTQILDAAHTPDQRERFPYLRTKLDISAHIIAKHLRWWGTSWFMAIQRSLEVPPWDDMDRRGSSFAFPCQECLFSPAELSWNADDSLEEDSAAHLQCVLATINIYIPLAFEGKH